MTSAANLELKPTRREPVFGVWNTHAAPACIEITSQAWFDLLLISGSGRFAGPPR
jgi:hypothetical protein